MKYVANVLLLLYFITIGNVVQAEDSSAVRLRVYKIVSTYEEYPDLWNDSLTGAYVDSLRRYSQFSDYIAYAHDTSVILRFIGFISLLNEDEIKAYEIVKEYCFDSTEIVFRVPCTLYESSLYNQLIIQHYYEYLKLVYMEGSSGFLWPGYVVISQGKNLKKYHAKRKELMEMLKEKSLTSSLEYIKRSDKGQQ